MEGEAMDMFASAKGSYKVTCTDQVSHITFRDCRVHIFFPTTFLEIAVYKLA